MGVVLAIVAGYLLGTFPSAVLVTRLATRGKVDIREVGSGNPGTLNAIHELGTVWGIVVLVLDVAKGIGAAFLGGVLGGDAGAYLGATAAIVGHIFPVWTGFRGGKGVATAAGACIAVFPAFVAINFVLAMVLALVSHRATLGTYLACAIWVVAAVLWWAFGWWNVWGPEPDGWLVVFSAAGAGLVLWAFRARSSPSGPSVG
jgi:glycerol-3-phosphate acyltransferase PlsY